MQKSHSNIVNLLLAPDEVSKNAIWKGVLLAEDLSNGSEKVPIRCVMDGDAMEPCSCSLCTDGGSSTSPRDSQPWNNFVYITKRPLDPSLGLDTKVCVRTPVQSPRGFQGGSFSRIWSTLRIL